MLGVVLIVSASAIAVATVAGRVAHVRAEHARWQAIANTLGLRYGRHGWQGGWAITGEVDGLSVVIGTEVRHAGRGLQTLTRLTLDASEHMPLGLVVGDEHYWYGYEPHGSPGIRVGSRAFDSKIGLRGDPLEVTALFNEPTRVLLLRCISRFRVHIERGQIIFERAGSHHLDAALLEEGLELMRRVASALSLSRLQQRLAHSAMHDSSPAVRRRNLHLLISHFPSTEATLQACEHAAFIEVRPELRLPGAMALGRRGWPVVAQLGSALTVSVELRERAARHLLRTHPERAAPVLETFLESRSGLLQRAAIDGLAQRGQPMAPERLLDLLEGADDETVICIARALGQAGDTRAEPRLLTLLEQPSRQSAALQALAHVGTADSLPALQPLARRGEHRNLARQALFRIRSRLGVAGAGALSLARDETAPEGALSLSDEQGERGQLAIAEEES